MIRQLTLQDMPEVVDIHSVAFPDSALTKLGNEAIRRYYEWQMLGPHDAVNIGAAYKDQLIGFCFSGVFRGAMGGFLRKNRLFLVLRILTHPWLVANPLVRDKLTNAINILRIQRKIIAADIDSSKTYPLSKNSFGILSIAVLPQYQGQGVAQELMMYAEQKAIEHGFECIGLTVQTTNGRAIQFYEKIGWQRIQVDTDWNGRMTKKLNYVITDEA